MRDLCLWKPSRIIQPQASALPLDLASEGTSPGFGNSDLLAVLEQSVEDREQSTESILTAIADAARVLSRAEGTAVALHFNGTILCRARSGSMAPELGAPLKTDSGISGECLRSASILVCSDALRDSRVDPEVCRKLGIRSIAAVPLRGRLGMAGILEAFSAHPGTFGSEQIHFLRSLGEIAEKAYAREQRLLQSAGASPKVRGALAAAITDNLRRTPALLSRVFAKKNQWIIASAVIAVLLVAIVVRMGWHQTQDEIAASESAPKNQGRSGAVREDDQIRPAPRVVPLSPGSRIASTRSDERSSLLRNAAEQGTAEEAAITSGAADSEGRNVLTPTPGTSAVPKRAIDASASEEPPPAVDLTPSAQAGALGTVVTSSEALPQFGGPVSQAVPASVIYRTEPVYPQQARVQRIAGSVVLDVTIGKNGSVSTTNVISGPPELAKAAVAAVRNWRYHAATLGGQPAESQTRVTFVFKLP